MPPSAKPEQFIGTWKLLSMIASFKDGSSKAPYGENPLGYITYTADGYMHAILMNAKRPRVRTQPEEFGRREGARRLAFAIGQLPALARTTAATLQSAAYSAQWEIRGDEVVHHVKAAVLPDWIGTDLVRSYAFEDDRLTLTAQYDDGENIALVWRKV